MDNPTKEEEDIFDCSYVIDGVKYEHEPSRFTKEQYKQIHDRLLARLDRAKKLGISGFGWEEILDGGVDEEWFVKEWKKLQTAVDEFSSIADKVYLPYLNKAYPECDEEWGISFEFGHEAHGTSDSINIKKGNKYEKGPDGNIVIGKDGYWLSWDLIPSFYKKESKIFRLSADIFRETLEECFEAGHREIAESIVKAKIQEKELERRI